jgi:hypothetical protein
LEGLLHTNPEQHTEEDHNNMDTEMETAWGIIKQSIISAATQTTGEKNKGSNAERFDKQCTDVLKRKNTARINMLQHATGSNCETYNDSQGKANKICQKKKRDDEKATRYKGGT